MAATCVSVYPDIEPLERIAAYLEVAARHGVGKVFSSMFSVEGTNEEVLAYFQQLIEVAHGHGMAVDLDVNHQFIAQLGASAQDLSVFAGIGVDILRLDVPYGDENDLDICRNPHGIKIEFNASFGLEHIQWLLDQGVPAESISLCHNFYPQRYTGMRWDTFLQVNEAIKKMGVRCAAFVSSQEPGTHGVWDARCGLPTVERLRDLPLETQARMVLLGGCDEVCIGNAYASEAELAALEQVTAPFEPDPESPVLKMMMKLGNARELPPDNSIVLRVELDPAATALERDILFTFYPHRDVGDSSEWIWRSRMPRFVYAKQDIPARSHGGRAFEVGDVVVVNDSYRHYAAEVQVVEIPIIDDGTRNLVGHLDENEFEMLRLAEAQNRIIRFVEA